VALARDATPAAGRSGPGDVLRRPVILIAARYDSSPVGAYLELAVARPGRPGPRPGLTVTTMVVDSEDSRRHGRALWAFPKQLGTLRWIEEDGRVTFLWEERGLVLRARSVGPGLPVFAPFRARQERGGDHLLVPGRLTGTGRVARLEASIPAGDELAGLSGPHLGMWVRRLRLVVHPARRLLR
jgi:hypothetical protein